MTSDVPSLADFIELGESLLHIQNPQVANVNSYAKELRKFLDLLLRCGLVQTQTAATPLADVGIRYNSHTETINAGHSAQLRTLISSISRVLYREVNSRSVIVTAFEELPKPLLDLPARLGRPALEPHQEALRQDIVTCFKANAFRPAIVVAWALGFDLVRWWVHSDSARLADFNLVLSQRTQNKRHRQIVKYHDFFSENEAFVLEICRDASGSLQLFSTKTHRLLENLLDERNAFAHANYAGATGSEANAYIERLLRVLTDSPFV